MKQMIDLEAREIVKESRSSTDYAENVRRVHAERLTLIDGILNLIEHSYTSEPCNTSGRLYNAPFVVSGLDNQEHAVAAMQKAGAILIGKTKHGLDPLGLDTEHNIQKNHSTRTPNPWDFNRVAGGVSGSTAAAVASGCAAFSVAADHCGDLIISANFCGTVALRPTLKASTHGWHCRSVSDAKEIFIAGSEESFIHSINSPTVWIPTDYSPYVVSKEVFKTLTLCTEGLLDSGISIRGINPPIFKQAFSMWASQWEPPENYRPKSPIGSLAMMMHQRLHEVEPMFGSAMSESANELKEAITTLLFPSDVIMCPAFPTNIPKPKSSSTPPMSFVFSALFAALDLPALHIPVGFNKLGHPIGIQLVAAPGCESALFRVGTLLEEKFRGWTRAQPFPIKGLF